MKKFLIVFLGAFFLCFGCTVSHDDSGSFSSKSESGEVESTESAVKGNLDGKDKSFGADGAEKSVNKKISFACWNIQTFFDANLDGTEYSDFKKDGNWSKEKYLVRLQRLCEVMCNLNPDVFVLEEVESLAVVQDIANFLAGNSWSKNKSWRYACFSRNTGASIGCAVFSRYEISELKVHNLDVRIQKEKQPASRPIMQLSLNVGTESLGIFVNHWKSKSGGSEETEIWRDWQEALLGKCVEKSVNDGKNCAYVLCGDFNRDAKEFVCEFENRNKETGMNKTSVLEGKIGNAFANVVLRTFGNGTSSFVKVYSPWFYKSGNFVNERGSYFYQKKWERIDNIFTFGNLEILGFEPASEGDWTKEDGTPFKYSIYNGNGYSDHLPLVCTLLF